MTDLILRFSRFDRVSDNEPRADWRTWHGFIDEFSRHAVRTGKDGPLVSFNVYKPDATRGIDGILECTALGGDVDPDRVSEDKLDRATVEAVCAKLNGLAFLIYSTWGEHAKPGHPSFRIVLAFSRPVSPEQYYAEWERLNNLLGGILDPDCRDPSRVFYTPSCPPERAGQAFVRVGEGAFWVPGPTSGFTGPTSKTTRAKTGAPAPTVHSEDLTEVRRKLAASTTTRYGPVLAEFALRLETGEATTDGWGSLLNDVFLQALIEAGATDEQIEALHRHEKAGRRHTWRSDVRRIRNGRKRVVKARASTLAEKEPAFAEIERSLGSPSTRPASPWAGKPGWEDETELEIKTVLKKVGRGEDAEFLEEPVERAYLAYNSLVSERQFRPFRTLSGEPRVAVPTSHGVEVHDPRTEDFVDWVGYRYYAVAGDPIPDRALKIVAKVLAGRASAPDLPRPRIVDLSIRIAPVGRHESILDLGDPDRRCVRIGATGWSVERVAMPVFDRPGHMLPLPEPAKAEGVDGDWTRTKEIFRFVSVGLPDADDILTEEARTARALKLEGQQLLVLVELVQSLLAPRSPKMVTILNGDEGSGKSHAAAKLAAVTDPSIVQHVPVPETEQDLLSLALNRATISLDNVSHIDLWLSDALARLCTGTGLAKRELYTNRGEVISRLIPRLIANGITCNPKAPDLIRRALFLWANRPDHALGDEEYEAAWEEAHPRILGGLLDLTCLTARVLRDSPPEGNGDSMADFARMGRAVALAIGKTVKDFDAALEENKSRQLAAAEENPWVGVLQGVFGALKPGETITPESIARRVSSDHRDSFLKGVSSQEVGNAIARARRTLTALGLPIEKRRGHAGVHLYFVRILKSGVTGVTLRNFTSQKEGDTYGDTTTLGVTSGVTPPGEVSPGGNPPAEPDFTSEKPPQGDTGDTHSQTSQSAIRRQARESFDEAVREERGPE